MQIMDWAVEIDEEREAESRGKRMKSQKARPTSKLETNSESEDSNSVRLTKADKVSEYALEKYVRFNLENKKVVRPDTLELCEELIKERQIDK